MPVITPASARVGLFSLGLAFAASPLALAAVIEGNVSAEAVGAPVSGATVTIEETGATTVTQRDGSFRFANVPAGDYTLRIDYFGAESQTVSVSATDTAPARLDIALGEGALDLGIVLVTGQRGALFAARQQERASDSLITVLSSDAIGSLPDQNVAESLRRAAGVSIQLDQGEGRFVSIRGLDSALNGTSINGVRLPAPEGDTRSVALDVIDADALESIVISKSLTPDQDGDGIGGNIDIRTSTAFDRGGRYLRAKAEGIYSESSEEWGEKISVSASDIFMDGALGIAGSVTWNRRDFETENVETDGAWVTDNAFFPYPEEYEMRDYIVERERLSAALNFDYKLGGNTDLYLRTLFNEFQDQEFRSRVEVKLDDAELVDSAGPGIAVFAEGDEIEFDRDIKDRLEKQQIWSTSIGGESLLGATTIDYQLAYSHSEEEEPNRIDTDFRADDVGDVTDAARLGLDVTDTQLPNLFFVDPVTTDYYYNAANFEFDGLEFLNGITEDDEFSGQFNIRHDATLLGNPGFWKIGGKARIREKSRDVDSIVFDGFDGDDLLLSQFEGTVDFPLDAIGPVPAPGPVRSFFNQNRGAFEEDSAATAISSNAEDYDAEENVYAAYAMAQISNGDGLELTFGGRLEVTDWSATGRIASEITEPARDDFDDGPAGEAEFLAALETFNAFVASEEAAGGVRVDDDVIVRNNGARDSYSDFLPSVNLKYDSGDNFVFRAAYYESIARPNFSAFVPSAALERDEVGEINGEVGNPDIQRQEAINIDASMDFYFGDAGVVSIGAFYKDIDNYIAERVFFDETFFGVTYDEASQDINLENADLLGAELSYYNAFEDLPSPFDGFLVGANFTRVTGSAEIENREINLPRLSDTIANLIVGYDKYGLDLRVALSYRSEYLDEIDAGGIGVDRYVDERFQLDLTAKYRITDQFQITAEVANITDEPFEAYLADGDRKLLSQYEEYGYTARFGARFTY